MDIEKILNLIDKVTHLTFIPIVLYFVYFMAQAILFFN